MLRDPLQKVSEPDLQGQENGEKARGIKVQGCLELFHVVSIPATHQFKNINIGYQARKDKDLRGDQISGKLCRFMGVAESGRGDWKW